MTKTKKRRSRRRRRRKLSKEVCQVLPSPACGRVSETSYLHLRLRLLLFILIRARIHKRMSGRYILASKVERKKNEKKNGEEAKTYNHHPRSRRRDGDFRFRITSEEEQNTTRKKNGERERTEMVVAA